MRKNYRVVVFAAGMFIVGAVLGRPLAAGEPVEAEPPDRYSDLLQFVTIPPSELPKDIRLIERAEDTPLIPVSENPGLIVEPEKVKSIAGFFGLREASDLESVRAAVTAIYEGKGDGPNEIGVYGIYISDRKTAKCLFQKFPKERDDFSYINKGPLLLCLWRDGGVRESAFEAIRDYFKSAEFKPCGDTEQAAVKPGLSNEPREETVAADWILREAPIPDNLSGQWLMTLPGDPEHIVTFQKFEQRDVRRYRLDKPGALAGVYEVQGDELVVIKPDDERMTGFAWKALNKNVLLLVKQRLPSPNGANYIGATLSRLRGAKPEEPEPKSHNSEPVEAGKNPRDQIGTVLGEPVYRDQIREDKRLSAELHRLFGHPVTKKYREAHKEEITPTEEQIKAAAEYFMKDLAETFKKLSPKVWKQLQEVEERLAAGGVTKEQRRDLKETRRTLQEQLRPEPRSFAKFVLGHRKFHRHLYKNFGGGRLLWQQRGVEAFDAMWNWLKSFERKGAFQITDPELRAEFYKYWTSQDGRSSLIDEPERIRKFLEPEWAPSWSANE